MGHPNQHYVGRTLTPDAVINEDSFGGRNHFFARKYPSLSAATGAFDGHKLIIRITDDLDKISKILNSMLIYRFNRFQDGIVISLGKLVRKER